MSNIDFSLEPETSKPTRKYRKGSKYDPIIEAFLNSPHELVKVEIPDKNANYIRTQIKKRLEEHGSTDIEVSVVNNTCYLEKVSTKKPTKKKKVKDTEPEPEPETPV